MDYPGLVLYKIPTSLSFNGLSLSVLGWSYHWFITLFRTARERLVEIVIWCSS